MRVLTFVSPDRRRAIWDLTINRGRSVREVSRLTGVPERQIVQVLKARMWEEIERAVALDRLRRTPPRPSMAVRQKEAA